MSRYSYGSGKLVSDSLRRLDIRSFRKSNFLRKGIVFASGNVVWKSNMEIENGVDFTIHVTDELTHNSSLTLHYIQTDHNTGEHKAFGYDVQLVSTPCNYGGVRWWFICPLTRNGIYCGKRVGFLYKSRVYFGCRHCYNLTYASRNASPIIRSYIFNLFENKRRLERLYGRMKRRTWAGRPTRFMRRIIKLQNLIDQPEDLQKIEHEMRKVIC